jgi:CheY-like chemotaxis protein
MRILLFGLGHVGVRPLGRVLARLGHETVAEDDGAAAFARLEAGEMRVVIADGRLPKFAWIDLCRKLRENPPTAGVHYILLESTSADASHEEWAAEAGVDDFLYRPSDERELRRLLLLASRRLSAAATRGQRPLAMPQAGELGAVSLD